MYSIRWGDLLYHSAGLRSRLHAQPAPRHLSQTRRDRTRQLSAPYRFYQ
jgi:hypothetical protein